MAKLRRVVLNGFKSIKAVDLELRALNVMIGANGAGKSNLVSFFKMLNEMMGMRLQTYIGSTGRAQSLLHFGPKVTPQMEAQLEFEVDNGVDTYAMRLFHAAGDTLIEEIDDRPHAAPGKRIIAELPDYEGAKSVIGPQVAELIGLKVISDKCPHFGAWLSRLEKLGGQL